MQTNWSLNELYESFDCPEFQADYAQVNEKCQWLKTFCETHFSAYEYENAAQAIGQYMAFQIDFGQKVLRMCDFCDLSLSVNVDDQTAMKYLESLETALTEMSGPETKFAMYLKNMPQETLDTAIETDNMLRQHQFYLNEIKSNARYLLSEAEENVISKLETTGSSAWAKLQENIVSSITCDVQIGGELKKLPFAEVRNLAYDASEAVRQAAFDAEQLACQGVAKASAAALNGIKGEVITLCKLRGYESPLAMTLTDSRMDAAVLNALLSAMKKNLGIFTPYFKKKAQLLGKESLPFSDLFAPIGDFDMKYTYEAAVDYVVDKFSDFSPHLGAFARTAADRAWIDVYPRKGKRGGAFCQNLHYLGESRFLLNFSGNFNDVLTLAHELGHGYHGYCLKDESFLNSDYPMPIAETASTLCETIVINAALKTASKAEARVILENDISSCAQVTVDILSRFLFEDEVFKRRREGSLSVEEFCQIMLDCQKQTYGSGLDESTLHPYMWVVKSHYYSAYFNYYNFPYAFGQLFAKGLYALFQQKGSAFVETYDQMLAATGRMNLKDVAAIAGIDLTDERFWEASLRAIQKDIDLFVAD